MRSYRANQSRTIYFVFAFVLTVLLTPVRSEAASATWSKTMSDTYLAYAWNNGGCSGTGGYTLGLANPSFGVTYNAQVLSSSGVPIASSGTVTSGQSVILKFQPHQSSDISWFGTGYSTDTPFGEWGTSAPALTCDSKDQVTTWSMYGIRAYIPLVIAPPTQTLSNLSGLSCGVLTHNSDGSDQTTCTVTATSGTLSPTFDFAATTGTLYYRYDKYPYSCTPNACVANNTPMALMNAGSGATIANWYQKGGTIGIGALWNASTTPFQLSVTDQSISYSLTVSPPAASPNTPTVTCPATATVGQNAFFTVTGTDPNGLTIRYGMDWTGSSSTPNEWTPVSGYVLSGTQMMLMHTWASAGIYGVRALTENSQGGQSGWSTGCTVTVTLPPPPTILFVVSPTSVITYASSLTASIGSETAVLSWYSIGATSCTASDSWSGSKDIGFMPITWASWQETVGPYATAGSYLYTLSCTGLGGTVSKTVTVTVNDTFPVTTFTGTYAGLPAQTNLTTLNLPVGGGSVNLNWSVTNAASGICTGYSTTGVTDWATTGTDGKPVTGTNVSVTVSGTTTFDLDCWNTSTTPWVAATRQSVVVNVAVPPSTLKICQDSCQNSYRTPRGQGGATTSFSLVKGTSQDLVACYNTVSDCSDSSGDVTASPGTVWAEDASNNIISLSSVLGKERVTGDAPGTENFTAQYSGATATMAVSVTCVETVTCTSEQNKVCSGKTVPAGTTLTGICGPVYCEGKSGKRYCDFNWKEVAP
ncbi:MAG: hypothetical protein Q7S04_00110 [Candidatus Moranbacteria bacterium]|nr:hypothetical protein [Candidatus Moranbacteria bacterium]